MKAITLTQPWATLVMLGQKQWETRSWRTHYTGALAIHLKAYSTGREAKAGLDAYFRFCSTRVPALGTRNS